MISSTEGMVTIPFGGKTLQAAAVIQEKIFFMEKQGMTLYILMVLSITQVKLISLSFKQMLIAFLILENLEMELSV